MSRVCIVSSLVLRTMVGGHNYLSICSSCGDVSVQCFRVYSVNYTLQNHFTHLL